jgi:hypothetical protein
VPGADLIPTGRTSLVKKGNTPIQVQTEYARRPAPRVTTTILKDGQVLHKIERTLGKIIDSVEEKNKIEVTIRRQHAEVLAIIEGSKGRSAEVPEFPKAPPRKLTTEERLARIPGVNKLYRLDNEGNFVDANTSENFKRVFADVFKSLHDLISVFKQVSGDGSSREKGVYEIEQDGLYLISTGEAMYFFCVERPDLNTDYEKAIGKALRPSPFADKEV